MRLSDHMKNIQEVIINHYRFHVGISRPPSLLKLGIRIGVVLADWKMNGLQLD